MNGRKAKQLRKLQEKQYQAIEKAIAGNPQPEASLALAAQEETFAWQSFEQWIEQNGVGPFPESATDYTTTLEAVLAIPDPVERENAIALWRDAYAGKGICLPQEE